MSLWEFAATVEGWVKAKGSDTPVDAPSDEEHDMLVAKFAHV